MEEKPTKKKGGNRGLMELTPPKVFKVDILDPLAPVLSPSGLNDISGNIRFSGTLAGLAFVHSKVRFMENMKIYKWKGTLSFSKALFC